MRSKIPPRTDCERMNPMPEEAKTKVRRMRIQSLILLFLVLLPSVTGIISLKSTEINEMFV